MDQFLVDGDFVWKFHGLGDKSVYRRLRGEIRRMYEFIVNFDTPKNQADAR